jgi:hypothetical protein
MAAAGELLTELRDNVVPVQPFQLGHLGPAAYDDTHYSRYPGFTRGTTSIPYVVECWATCARAEQRGAGSVVARLLLNRTH